VRAIKTTCPHCDASASVKIEVGQLWLHAGTGLIYAVVNEGPEGAAWVIMKRADLAPGETGGSFPTVSMWPDAIANREWIRVHGGLPKVWP
jgi:hypothetical protein